MRRKLTEDFLDNTAVDTELTDKEERIEKKAENFEWHIPFMYSDELMRPLEVLFEREPSIRDYMIEPGSDKVEVQVYFTSVFRSVTAAWNFISQLVSLSSKFSSGVYLIMYGQEGSYSIDIHNFQGLKTRHLDCLNEEKSVLFRQLTGAMNELTVFKKGLEVYEFIQEMFGISLNLIWKPIPGAAIQFTSKIRNDLYDRELQTTKGNEFYIIMPCKESCKYMLKMENDYSGKSMKWDKVNESLLEEIDGSVPKQIICSFMPKSGFCVMSAYMGIFKYMFDYVMVFMFYNSPDLDDFMKRFEDMFGPLSKETKKNFRIEYDAQRLPFE